MFNYNIITSGFATDLVTLFFRRYGLDCVALLDIACTLPTRKADQWVCTVTLYNLPTALQRLCVDDGRSLGTGRAPPAIEVAPAILSVQLGSPITYNRALKPKIIGE